MFFVILWNERINGCIIRDGIEALFKFILFLLRGKFDIASKYRSDNLPKYSEDEELAAEMIIYLVAYLKRFGCEDIEQLIKDKIEFDDRKND